MKFMIPFFLLLLIAGLSVASDGSSEEQNPKKASPHGVSGACHFCHVESEDTLNGWFVLPSTKKKLTLDYVAVCRQCHGVDFGHGVGRVPKLNREELPLDNNGKIACAITCHDMHVKSTDSIQSRYFLRLKGGGLCLSCHNK
jgi:hypothetical protein